MENYLKHIIISDIHFPFHDPSALSLTFQFIKSFKPDRITLNGDILEFYDLSRFPKNFQSLSVQDEFEMTKDELLVPLRKIFKGPIIFQAGNHEHRLMSYLVNHAKELQSLKALSVPAQLGLDKFNIQWRYSGTRETWYEWGAILIGHWDKALKQPGVAARDLAMQYGHSVIQGHTHKSGETIIRLYDRHIGAYEYGCLCSLDPHWEAKPNWTHGFCVAYRKEGGKRYDVKRIVIINNKFVFSGKEFSI